MTDFGENVKIYFCSSERICAADLALEGRPFEDHCLYLE